MFARLISAESIVQEMHMLIKFRGVSETIQADLTLGLS
jgi:hypothetical protein